jgi:acetylornithine deacetylase/succinyl-diaminopimelate desuccinylase-like protein
MPRDLEPVVARIDELRDEAVALLQELVATNSVNPNYPGVDRAEFIGGETRCNDILERRYAAAGLETHRVAADPERSNLVGVRAGIGGGRSLIMNGHVDTVPPAEADRWTCGSPWSPELRDGDLYGLGSTDMKGSAVSMWLAAQALQDVGIQLAGDLQLHSVVGEESAEYQLGTLACVEAGFRADGAVVTEPTGAANRAKLDIAAEPGGSRGAPPARAPPPPPPTSAPPVDDRDALGGLPLVPDAARRAEHARGEPPARDPAGRPR